jgi:peroxiredoxin
MRAGIWFTDGRRWRWLMATVLVLGGAWIALTRPAEGAVTSGAIPSPHQGFAAPDFELATLEGGTVRLSDLRGQVVVLNFWASWCPPCRAEMPDLQALHDAYAGRGVVVVSVNSTVQDDEQAARDFAAEFGLTFPVPPDPAGEATRAYQVQALPTTFVIDRAGVIDRVIVGGPLGRSALDSVVLDLLAGEG